jgi:hypothetical protein
MHDFMTLLQRVSQLAEQLRLNARTSDASSSPSSSTGSSATSAYSPLSSGLSASGGVPGATTITVSSPPNSSPVRFLLLTAILIVLNAIALRRAIEFIFLVE